VNDAPSGADKTVTTNEDTAYSFTAADFGFTDPNDAPANTLLAVKITTLPGSGTLTDNNVAVTGGQVVSLADINAGLLKFTPAANANGNGYASFTFQVQDNGGSPGVELDSTPNTITVNVTAVDDAAVAITAITTDSGTAGDFTTNDTTLIVSGTNGALGAGEKVQISSDGSNWFDVTQTTGTTWSYDDRGTPHPSNVTYHVQVVDTAGNVGNTASQTVTIDTAQPAAGTLSFANLTDTGTANTPPVTQDTAFDLSLAGQEAGSGVVYQVSVNGGAFANTTQGQSGLADGDYVFRALVSDAAGNTSTSNSIEVVVDNSAPAAVATVTALSADSGTAGDFITNVASQTVSGTYTGLLGAGEKIQVSADGGTTWVDATAGAGTWSASGVTLVAGTGALSVHTIDAANNTTVGTGHSYTLTSVLPAMLTIVTPNGYDMHGLYGDIANSNINLGTADGAHFDAINAGSGHTFHVIGIDLTYDGGGLTGGTINEIDILDSVTGALLVTIAGFAIDAVAMNNAITAFNSSDPSQLTAIFNQYSYTATGGSGNDIILGFANADSFNGGGGLNNVDYVHFGSGITANLADPSQNTGNAAGDTYTNIVSLIGTNFSDTLIGDGNTNALEGGGGADTLIGNGGTLDFASYVHANTGNANVGVTANLADPTQNTGDALGDSYTGINSLIGSNFADTLTGNASDNNLRGRGGGDTLDGGGGSDTADYFNGPGVRADLSNPASNTGDAAGDTYISIENLRGSNFNDTLIGDAGNNRLDGGLGIDRTIYMAAAGAIAVDMAAGTVSGPGVGSDSLISIESVRGSAFDDNYVATGYTGASAIGSLPPAFNEFEGMAGNDTIIGSNTALSYLSATDFVTVDIAAGTATGDASVGTDTFTGVQIVRGSAFGDTLRGSNNAPGIAETFEGRGGDDFIDGRGGFDRVLYSFRTDSIATGGITVDLAGGTVTGDPIIGSDTLRSIEAVRGTNFADIYDASGFTTSNVNGPNFGSAGANSSGAAFNEFEGLGGNDKITGNGNTRISFINANAGVTVDLDSPTALPGSTGVAHGTAPGDLAGIGNDTIFGGVNSIIGSSFADMFYGSLTPAGFAEQYDGGAGNDTIDGRGGFDQALYNSDLGTASGISVDMAAGTVSGDASIGTDTLISVESVRGTNFEDIYVAAGFNGASADLPNGTSFNEFEGMAGDDTITGNGNTRISYVSATAGVTVDLAAGTSVGNASVGTDTFTGVSRARGSNFNDTIFGDGNNNVLDGQGGSDVLGGRGGNDTLTGGGGADQFFYSAGVDTITDFDQSGGSFSASEGDVINLVGSGVTTWEQLQPLMSQVGADTVINFGAGNTLTLSNVVLGDLAPANFAFSAPISGDLGVTASKGGMTVLTTRDFHAVDPNATAGQLTFTVSGETHGYVAFAGNPGLAINTFTEADLETGTVLFVHDGSDTTQATFKVSVSDGTVAGAATTIIVAVPTAVIDVLTAGGFDFEANDPISPMGSGEIQPTPTPATQITIVNATENLRFVFEGVGLTLDNDSSPTDITGGTITAIHVFTNDLTPAPLLDLIANVDAAAWYDAAVARAGGDGSLFDALTSEWSISLFGAAGPDSFGSGDASDYFRSSGGIDRFDGGFGFDRANYTSAGGAIDVFLAAGVVTKYADGTRTAVAGVDLLQSIELVTGTNFRDTFNAVGFSASSPNAGSTVAFNTDGTLNDFEGRGGDDIITGNGNTRISYLHATAGVTVTFTSWISGQGASGIAVGDSSVGTDTFTGVNRVRGSYFDDVFVGSTNDPNTAELYEGRGGNDLINGGGGFDKAVYSNEDAGIFVHLAAGKVVGGPNTGIDTLLSVESVIGTNFADTYTADVDVGWSAFAFGSGSAANVGSNGSFNEFEGAGGNDTITGNGNTRVAFYSAIAGVTVTLGTNGSGTSFGTEPGDLAGVGTDTFVSGVKDVRGSEFGDIIAGNGANNRLEGQGGNDVINGRGGDDTLTGGTGSDIFVYNTNITSNNDTIIDLDSGEGDRIDLRGIAAINNFSDVLSHVPGGSPNTIQIDATNNLILNVPVAALQASDFLFNGQVAVTVQASDGYNFGTLYDDIAHGNPDQPGNSATSFTAINISAGLTFRVFGSGFTYDSSGPTGGTVNEIDIYDAFGHILATSNGWSFDAGQLSAAINDYLSPLNSTGGLDAIFGTVSYSAVGNFVGPNAFNNNSINFGADTFLSGIGNDVFNGLTNANGDFFNGGDTVDYSHAPNGVTVSLLLQGISQDTGGAGFDTLINIESLRGSAFSDTLTSNGFNTAIEGGAGDDILIGQIGGNETVSYEHATAGVTVDLSQTEAQDTIGAGTDTISNFETLRGSSHDDILSGGNNTVLEGGAGADQLTGVGGSVTASYEHSTAGVTASLSNSGLNTGDALGDTFTFISNLRGSHFNDILIGDGNSNVLDGNGTRDGGSDILTGNGGADTFVFSGSHVTITDFSHSDGDLIDLSFLNFGTGISETELQALITAAPDAHTLDLGDGQVLAVTNVNVSTLQSSSDFILHH
jgi:Ca2+-binding RTX toxin-like protein